MSACHEWEQVVASSRPQVLPRNACHARPPVCGVSCWHTAVWHHGDSFSGSFAIPHDPRRCAASARTCNAACMPVVTELRANACVPSDSRARGQGFSSVRGLFARGGQKPRPQAYCGRVTGAGLVTQQAHLPRRNLPWVANTSKQYPAECAGQHSSTSVPCCSRVP